MTLVEELLGANTGEVVVREVDLVYAHDGTMPLIIGAFRRNFTRVVPKTYVFFDHVFPARLSR